MLTGVMSSPLANVEEEDDDEGGWGPYAAAQNTFMEAARAVGGAPMLAAALPWVQANIAAAEWQKREAAAMVLGMLQESTAAAHILAVDRQAVAMAWARLLSPAAAGAREASNKVREALAYFVAKAYYVHGPALLTPAAGEPPAAPRDLIKAAVGNLCTLLASDANPGTMRLAATGINYVFAKFCQDRDEGTVGALFERVAAGAPLAGSETTIFSGQNGIFDILTLLVRKGVEATAADESEVSLECFSAVNVVLEAAGVEDVRTISALLRDVGMAKLTESVQKCTPSAERPALGAEARQKEGALQERYLGLVHNILIKDQQLVKDGVTLLSAELQPLAPQLCSLLLALVDVGVASSEVWLILGTLIDSNLFPAPEDPPNRAGLTFWCRAEVLQAVHARIAKGLAAVDDANLLSSSFYAAGDVMRKLGDRAPPDLVACYVERAIVVLSDPEVELTVKPVALELFADYAGCMSAAKSCLYKVLGKVKEAAEVPNGVRQLCRRPAGPAPPPPLKRAPS